MDTPFATAPAVHRFAVHMEGHGAAPSISTHRTRRIDTPRARATVPMNRRGSARIVANRDRSSTITRSSGPSSTLAPRRSPRHSDDVPRLGAQRRPVSEGPREALRLHLHAVGSVYTDDSVAWKDENDTLATMPSGVDPYDLTPANASKYYGALKAFSEKEVEKTYPGMSLIIRPGLIVGPLDRSDRFTYWPVRIDKGGDVMAPGDPTDPLQIIHARDLAEWTIRMIEATEVGIYNANGPDKPLSTAEMLYGIKAITTSGAQFTWVPAAFLRERKVNGWSNMPVWISPKGRPGFSQRSSAKAVAKGLTFRPLSETAKATLEWHTLRPTAEQDALAAGKISGISAEREAAVLAA